MLLHHRPPVHGKRRRRKKPRGRRERSIETYAKRGIGGKRMEGQCARDGDAKGEEGEKRRGKRW